MIQGKQTTLNYKIKKRIQKPKDKWHVINGAHAQIISLNDFKTVNSLLAQDTRTAPSMKTVYPLSGLIYCGDCGNSIIRTKLGAKFYYICASGRKKDRCCTSRSIQIQMLEEMVANTLARVIASAVDAEKSIGYANSLPGVQNNAKKLIALFAEKQAEIDSCKEFKRFLYEDYKRGIISGDDYAEFEEYYKTRIAEARRAGERIMEETIPISKPGNTAKDWLTHFIRFNTFLELNRLIAVSFIERIELFSGKRINIYFSFQDTIETIAKERDNNG